MVLLKKKFKAKTNIFILKKMLVKKLYNENSFVVKNVVGEKSLLMKNVVVKNIQLKKMRLEKNWGSFCFLATKQITSFFKNKNIGNMKTFREKI